MAKTKFEIEGLKTLQKELAEYPDKVARRAGQAGATKGAAYLRTRMRRSMPPEVKSWFGLTAIRTIRLKRLPKDTVGTRVFAPNIFKIWERGRNAYTTKRGIHRQGSPQMSRFAFWHRGIDKNSEHSIQEMIDHVKAALFREAGKTYAKTKRDGAP